MVAIGLAAIGHLAWEAAQLPLYTLWSTGTSRAIGFALVHCTGGDVLITAATFSAAAMLARHRRWPAFGWRMALAAILLGAAYTIFSEWLNVEIRRTWSYAPAMPVVPWLGTGVAPLLQWLVASALVFALTAQRYGRATRRLR